MTAHKDARSVPRIGGKRLPDLLAENRQLIGRRVLARVQAEVPAYRSLPSEQLAGDIAEVIDRNLRMLIAVVETGAAPPAEELAALRESAARRAEEGIPVEYVLTAYHLGVQEGLDFVIAGATSDDLADVSATMALVLRYLQPVTAAVAGGYLEERQNISGDEQVTRHTLLNALLSGDGIDEAATRAGLPLPERYLVLHLIVGPHPDEQTPGVDPAVASRRKMRRLRVELQRRYGDQALTAITDSRELILVPAAGEVDWPRVRRLTAALAGAAGAPVTAGAEPAAPTGVRDAAMVARNLADLAAMLHRPPDVYRMDDLMLEYQLSRPSEARDQLAARLDPLDGRPELMATLAAFMRHDRARRATASELHLHPNTVDYRLRKVALLTGLDPMDSADTVTLEAALVARAARVPRQVVGRISVA
ncbi:MAG: PucR family transcriptional regulator [Micromonosporaceae bacterium]